MYTPDFASSHFPVIPPLMSQPALITVAIFAESAWFDLPLHLLSAQLPATNAEHIFDTSGFGNTLRISIQHPGLEQTNSSAASEIDFYPTVPVKYSNCMGRRLYPLEFRYVQLVRYRGATWFCHWNRRKDRCQPMFNASTAFHRTRELCSPRIARTAIARRIWVPWVFQCGI